FFLSEIDQFRRGLLHSKRQFIRSNPALNFRIFDVLESPLVEPRHSIKRQPLHLGREAVGVTEALDWVAFGIEKHADVSRGHEAAGPIRRAAANTRAWFKNNITGQVRAFCA